MRRAVLLALLALAASAPGAAAVEAQAHAWQWRVLDGRAQVIDDLTVTGPGSDVRLELPRGAHDVQAFVEASAWPWAWVGPRTVELRLGRLLDAPGAQVHVQVRYVVPAGPAGIQVQRTLTMPVAAATVAAELPEGWTATVDGAPLGRGELGARAAGDTLDLRLAPAAAPSPVAALAALVLLVLGATLLRARRARGRAQPAEMGLLDHLRELQGRLRNVVVAVAALMLFLFTFGLQPVAGVPLPVPSLTDTLAAQTFRLLAQQFVPPGVELVVVNPVSGALTQVEVALFLAVLVASPLIGYEAGAFLMPALLAHERRMLLKAVPAFTALFLAGALFAYAVMVPTMMRVLYGYAEGLGARPLVAVDSLVSFAVVVTLLFGLAFELPVGMVALAKLGLVSPATMAARWRHVVFGIFVVAAVITPDPSVVSQVLVAVPLLGLYLVGLVAARAAAPQGAGVAVANSA